MQLMRINTAIFSPFFALWSRNPSGKPRHSFQIRNSTLKCEKKKNLKREFTIGSSVVNSEEQLICPHPRVNHLVASRMILLKKIKKLNR